MPRPLLPPRYVNVPSAYIYNQAFSPTELHTWIVLRGLAWGKNETPELSWDQLERISGKSQSTLFGHLGNLRARNALQWRPAGKGLIIVSFDEGASSAAYEARPDSENSEEPILSPSLFFTNKQEQLKYTEEAASRQSGIPEKGLKVGKNRAKEHPAVTIYRQETSLEPNGLQALILTCEVGDLETWQDALVHWLEHGWNPRNVLGLLELYNRGGRQACRYCTQDEAWEED
jgi:hypothetical protein